MEYIKQKRAQSHPKESFDPQHVVLFVYRSDYPVCIFQGYNMTFFNEFALYGLTMGFRYDYMTNSELQDLFYYLSLADPTKIKLAEESDIYYGFPCCGLSFNIGDDNYRLNNSESPREWLLKQKVKNN